MNKGAKGKKGGRDRDNFSFTAMMLISSSSTFLPSLVLDETPVVHLLNLICFSFLKTSHTK